jgi:hypothetical protein
MTTITTCKTLWRLTYIQAYLRVLLPSRLTKVERAQNITAGGITHTGSFREPEIIELTDSSDAYDTSSDFPDKLTDLVKSPRKVPSGITKKSVARAPGEFLPLFADESDADDGSILIL